MKKKYEIIFIEDTFWGKKNQKIKCLRGFAKYLFFNKKAIFSNEKNISSMNRIFIRERKDIEVLSDLILHFKFKVNEKGKLFSKLNLNDIINKLSEKNIYLNKNNFPNFPIINSIGEKNISVKIGDFSSYLKIIIYNEDYL